MRCGTKLGVLALAVAGMAAVCPAQGVVEAGALAGAAAGAGSAVKGAGAALGKAFGKTGEALGQSRKAAPRQDAGGRVPAKEARNGQAAAAQSTETPENAPKAEAFAGVAAGMEEEELRARLGPASSRIVMAEEGRMVEIRRYRAGGRELGSVRLVDGKVEEVRPARR